MTALSRQQILLRLQTARDGLRGYQEFTEDLTARRIDPAALADLVTSAGWLIELLEEEERNKPSRPPWEQTQPLPSLPPAPWDAEPPPEAATLPRPYVPWVLP